MEEALKKTFIEMPSFRVAELTRAEFFMAKAKARGTAVTRLRVIPSAAFDNGP
jgi:hypothetical protein